MKEKLKKIKLAKYSVVILKALRRQRSIFATIVRLQDFFGDYRKYQKLKSNPAQKLHHEDLYPRIWDKTQSHETDPIYLIQGCWCARKVFEHKPANHVDIASQALMVGIIAGFTPTTMVDLRPLCTPIPGLVFKEGNIMNLPFANESVESLSSICVIEHIGLGRYGDPLDQYGTEKSAQELIRILKPGGNLYISVPVDNENKTYFNAHRAFTRDFIVTLFKTLNLVEEQYIYGHDTFQNYDKNKGFGTGLFHFTK